MSGLVAAHGPFDAALGERMLARLAHRGPDGSGTRQVGDGAWLGSHYLTIVDPQSGQQPIHDATGGLWLIGDGEIYNHERLRATLENRRFHTRSDLETALALFDELGPTAFELLWGTFALIAAGQDGRFAVARDTFGLAPLYWARRGPSTVFASEMKAFDPDWLGDVEPFPPGHAWTPQEGLIPGPGYPTATPLLLRSRSPEEDPPRWVFDAVRETLGRAVDHAMDTDMPVGLLLSGGVDSSIIAAVAAPKAAERGGTLPTFSVGLAGSADLAAARTVAEHVGTDHHELVYTAEEAIAMVPEVIAKLESFDPTLVHSAVPNHLVAALAAQHVRIVLVGEGADELFAGYTHYERHDTAEALHEELVATLEGMHVGGLQRVDRVTGAHGLEPRLPFLDLDVVELTLALPPDWKLTAADRPAKWLLRRAFDGWVPDDVLWRPKEQFGEGTGMNDVLRDHFGATVTDEDLAREADAVDPPLRTREELAYYRIFTAALPGVDAQRTLERFAEA